MVYTVTFNCALDCVMSVPVCRAGEVNRAGSEKVFAGGKGINVASVLADFGVDAAAMGFVSGFTGDEVERLVRESGVKTDFIRLKNGMTRINVKIKSDKETEINGAGADVPPEAVRELIKKLEKLGENDMLVLAGSVPASVPRTIYGDIAKTASQKGVNIVVDAEGELLLNALPYRPFLVKPNRHELGEIFKTDIETRSDAAQYALKMRDMGARNVLVSLAGDGAVLACENGEVYESDAPKGKVLNSTGAGDSMTAGFIAAYLERGDYEYAFERALCVGSACAFSEGLAAKSAAEKLYWDFFGRVKNIQK